MINKHEFIEKPLINKSSIFKNKINQNSTLPSTKKII